MQHTEQRGHLWILFCIVCVYYCKLKAIKMGFRRGQAAQGAAVMPVLPHLQSGNVSAQWLLLRKAFKKLTAKEPRNQRRIRSFGGFIRCTQLPPDGKTEYDKQDSNERQTGRGRVNLGIWFQKAVPYVPITGNTFYLLCEWKCARLFFSIPSIPLSPLLFSFSDWQPTVWREA